MASVTRYVSLRHVITYPLNLIPQVCTTGCSIRCDTLRQSGREGGIAYIGAGKSLARSSTPTGTYRIAPAAFHLKPLSALPIPRHAVPVPRPPPQARSHRQTYTLASRPSATASTTPRCVCITRLCPPRAHLRPHVPAGRRQRHTQRADFASPRWHGRGSSRCSKRTRSYLIAIRTRRRRRERMRSRLSMEWAGVGRALRARHCGALCSLPEHHVLYVYDR